MKSDSKKIKAFIERWTGKGYEKGQSQIFWIELLQDILGVETPSDVITFEDQVKLDHTSFIDAYIDRTHVMIEQKSINKDLLAPIKQSDGSFLNPFQQAKRYSADLPYSKRPRWIITCNFQSFLIYDMEQPQGEPVKILLENLEKDAYKLQFIIDEGQDHIRREMEISIQAGALVGRLYDEFLKQYGDNPTADDLKMLNILCVRLVFCLYAEDCGLFGEGHQGFYNYMHQFAFPQMRKGLMELFRILNTPVEERDRFEEPVLNAFPYVAGGLFRDNNIQIPHITPEIADILLEQGSEGIDWSDISPTIFGAVFESTLNPETRRSGGMHYTSIENIHKVIDPLFMDDLKDEFFRLKEEPVEKKRRLQLEQFQTKLSQLKFLDPACGSGNFLTETYISMRRLENEVIKELNGSQIVLDFTDPIKVQIGQFYGIEINDFAVTVAQTALWIAESQMMRETEDIVHTALDFFPLKNYAHIVEGNALRMEWDKLTEEPVVYDYIMGNPPFVGARMMNSSQKDDVLEIFGKKWKNVGNLDYVCCWYKKASDLMQGTNTRAALVSTNSITQGEQVANLWKPLFDDGLHIDFAWRTFRWDSESTQKAHVHCVIVAFSHAPYNKENFLYYSNSNSRAAKHINAYLIDAPDAWIESRPKPICDVPAIGIGNKPIDGGNYLFKKNEKEEFVLEEPQSEHYFKEWYGADEFINRRPRYCLWLGDCSPAALRSMPACYQRVQNVREYRLSSPSPGTQKIADKPTRFHVENMPTGNYIVIPEVSSERRRYIPIGYMTPDVLCSNKLRLMPNATLFHFGILTSNVHMAWMRVVCGRMKSDYSYSVNIVYNNFPWPSPTPEQKEKIEQTAQAILDARALYPDCSLADLYDEVTMPPELRRAHQQNDRAVMEAYGFPIKGFTESDCVAELLKLYQQLTAR